MDGEKRYRTTVLKVRNYKSREGIEGQERIVRSGWVAEARA
jgi:hypothetical protein